MKQVMVRYKLKPDGVAENDALIHRVFEELTSTAPPNIRYGAFKLADGVSYVHVGFLDSDASPLQALAAFKAYTARIAERCEEPPVAVDLTAVAMYRLQAVDLLGATMGSQR